MLVAVIWGVLCVIGLCASWLMGGGPHTGEDVTRFLLLELSTKLSPAFIVAFWAGAVAALFSTCDAQMYSFLLCYFYKPKTGCVNNPTGEVVRSNSFVSAVALAVLFAACYFASRYKGIYPETIAFLMIPFCLTLFPGLCLIAKRKKVRVVTVALPALIYCGCAAKAFLAPPGNFTWSLVAPLIPVSIGLGILAFVKTDESSNTVPSGSAPEVAK
jgi:hypothetical protein